MTEDEAKTKWCPFARVASLHESQNPRAWIGVTGANRAVTSEVIAKKGVGDDGLPESCRCIGSACMAWRCDGSKFKDARTGALSDRDLTGHGAWIETGYCGLAGASQ